ncbi:hypothetical protein LINPERPRIM_LOCUS21044, partial [Linum perenne]
SLLIIHRPYHHPTLKPFTSIHSSAQRHHSVHRSIQHRPQHNTRHLTSTFNAHTHETHMHLISQTLTNTHTPPNILITSTYHTIIDLGELIRRHKELFPRYPAGHHIIQTHPYRILPRRSIP